MSAAVRGRVRAPSHCCNRRWSRARVRLSWRSSLLTRYNRLRIRASRALICFCSSLIVAASEAGRAGCCASSARAKLPNASRRRPAVRARPTRRPVLRHGRGLERSISGQDLAHERRRRRDKLIEPQRQPARRRRLASARDNEPDPAELWKLDPDMLEFVARHGLVAEGGVGQQNLIAEHAPENDEMIVTDGPDGDDDRSQTNDVIEIQIAVADPLVAAALRIALQIEQREALSDAHELRMRDVFFARNQPFGDLFFGDVIAELEIQ